MTAIVPYENRHQKGVESMMQEIAAEFEEDIIVKPEVKTSVVPDKYWVAMHQETVVGTIAIIVVDGNYGILKKMMVKKEFRGSSFGISKKLLKVAECWCQENQISRLYLGTMHQFKAAQAFYKKNGFTQIDENKLPGSFINNPLDKVFFEKDVNQI